MTLSDFKKIVQESQATFVWFMTPSGINGIFNGHPFKIAVDLDLDNHDDSDFIFAARDNETGVIKLNATSDNAMSNALTFHGSCNEGIGLVGEIY